ncbi:MAG: nucleotidyltransferase [Rariglobus sp.]|nr:nucleotidyltransferase [Rariglobus sp.]
MWGIIPAAGAGSRIQPLAFSKELLPVGSRIEANVEHPRAVSEYLIERMIRGGATKLCFVISPGKSDLMTYYGGRVGAVDVVYVVQPRPAGLCDALFRACSVIPRDEPVLIGLPDTIWFPCDGFALMPDDLLSFLLFPVKKTSAFDAVVMDDTTRGLEVQVKWPCLRRCPRRGLRRCRHAEWLSRSPPSARNPRPGRRHRRKHVPATRSTAAAPAGARLV